MQRHERKGRSAGVAFSHDGQYQVRAELAQGGAGMELVIPEARPPTWLLEGCHGGTSSIERLGHRNQGEGLGSK